MSQLPVHQIFNPQYEYAKASLIYDMYATELKALIQAYRKTCGCSISYEFPTLNVAFDKERYRTSLIIGSCSDGYHLTTVCGINRLNRMSLSEAKSQLNIETDDEFICWSPLANTWTSTTISGWDFGCISKVDKEAMLKELDRVIFF